jgi:hypothetical protein
MASISKRESFLLAIQAEGPLTNHELSERLQTPLKDLRDSLCAAVTEGLLDRKHEDGVILYTMTAKGIAYCAKNYAPGCERSKYRTPIVLPPAADKSIEPENADETQPADASETTAIDSNTQEATEPNDLNAIRLIAMAGDEIVDILHIADGQEWVSAVIELSEKIGEDVSVYRLTLLGTACRQIIFHGVEKR